MNPPVRILGAERTIDQQKLLIMNSQIPRRRVLLGGAVSAFAFTPSRTAQADTTFANFAFAATGAPSARTMPDRLAEVINVKEWGATGTGRTSDTAAVQAAINEAIKRGGGKVIFPGPASYLIDTPGFLTVGSSNP